MATFARLDTPPTAQKNIEDVMREFGCQLRKAREKQGWTIRDVAAAVGCSRPTVENAEAGKMRSRSEKLIAIADLFDLTLPDGVPSTLERRQAGAVKGRLVRDLNRQGVSVISAPSKTERVPLTTAPANGRADEDWEVVPSQRNGLWKTGPTEDDWDGMTEETAMVVHARAKADGFDPGPRPFMPHHATGVFRVSILDPSKRRDRIEVRSFEQYEAWANQAIITIPPTSLEPYTAPVEPTVVPEPSVAFPSVITWEPYYPDFLTRDGSQPRATLSPRGSVYLNKAALNLRLSSGRAWNQGGKATWFSGKVGPKTFIGIRLHDQGDYKVDYLPDKKGQSGASINIKKFAQHLGLSLAEKTTHHVDYDATHDILWFDPSVSVK